MGSCSSSRNRTGNEELVYASCIRSSVKKTVLKGRHRWVIDGFRHLPIQKTICVTSPAFLLAGKMFCLFVHNDGHAEPYAGSLSVFLQLVDQSNEAVHCDFRFSIIHPTDSLRNIVKPSAGMKSHIFHHSDSNWGFYELIKYCRLSSEHFFWNDDSLVVEVEIEITSGHRIQHDTVMPSFLPYDSMLSGAAGKCDAFEAPVTCSMRRDVLDLLKSCPEMKPDVSLKIGGDSIAAHICILSFRSKVFRAMFGAKMVESKTHQVVIESASLQSMKILIEFIYCDTFPISYVCSFDCAVEVFLLADRYDLEKLTELIVPMIARYLGVNNIFQAIQFADDHMHLSGGKLLRQVSQEFSRSHWEEILDYASNVSVPAGSSVASGA